MTDSTRFLNSTQAAARLGVKPATLYAYVSRGLLPRRRSADARTSLFDPADLARLERRSGTRRGSPAEVVVASELTLVDTAAGALWYRGLDPLQACRERRFEEVAGWLWTGDFEGSHLWRADARSLRVTQRAAAALGRSLPPPDRLQAMASAVAAMHTRLGVADVAAGTDLMACLVDGLPGSSAAGSSIAARLWPKLGDGAPTTGLLKVLDAALSVTCDHALTYSTLVARMSAAAGAGIAASVASALGAGIMATRASRFAVIESALAAAASDGSLRAADVMDRDAVISACSGPYPTGDPRARVLLEMLDQHAPETADAARSLADELHRRGGGPPTVTFAQAAVAAACGLRPGSGETIALVSRAAGWIAHALEEHARPTPYRPRLAYTGRPPRTSTPRRALDAVVDYLSRE